MQRNNLTKSDFTKIKTLEGNVYSFRFWTIKKEVDTVFKNGYSNWNGLKHIFCWSCYYKEIRYGAGYKTISQAIEDINCSDLI